MVGILIGETLTGNSDIHAVLVTLQREGMLTGVEVGVHDVAVFILVHEVTARGGEVESGGATQGGTLARDGRVSHNVQVAPLVGVLVGVNRLGSHLADNIALALVEHAGSQCGSVDVEHAQRLDGGGHGTGLHVVHVSGNFHALESRAALKAVAHHVGRGGGQRDIGQLLATGAQALGNLVAALGDNDFLEPGVGKHILANVHIIFQREVFNGAVSETIVADSRQCGQINVFERSISQAIVVDTGHCGIAELVTFNPFVFGNQQSRTGSVKQSTA